MPSEDQVMLSISSQSGLHPDEIARRTFPSARRGVDGEAVRRYLEAVAAEVRDLHDREQALRRRLQDAERRALEPELDEQTLLRAVGAETARILQTAHESAAEVISNAEARAAEMVRSVGDDAAAEASAIRDEARGEAQALTGASRAEAVALLESTRAECRRIVREARQLRANVLSDLTTRRRELRVQLEQLRTGRDSLVAVVDAVGESVDQLRDRLANAEHEARLAAAEAGERVVADEDEDELFQSADEIDIEIAVDLGEAGLGAESAGDAIGPGAGWDGGTARDGRVGAEPAAGMAADRAMSYAEPGESAPAVLVIGEAEVIAEDVAENTAEDVDEDVDGGELESVVVSVPATALYDVEEDVVAHGEVAAGPAPEGDTADGDSADGVVELSEAVEVAGDRPEAAGGAGTGKSRRSVDELFAKIRAGRAPADDPAGSVSSAAAPVTAEVPVAVSEAAPEAAPEADLPALETSEPQSVTAPAETAEPGAGEATDVEAGADTDEGTDADTAPERGAAADTAPERGAAADTAPEPDAPTVDAEAAALARRSELLAPVSMKLSRALKRTLQDDQNILLDALRHASGTPDLDVSLPEAAQRQRLEQATVALLADAWTVGHSWLGGPSPAKRAALEAGRSFATELATDVTRLLRHRLHEALSTAAGGGDGGADGASAAYREWRSGRIDMTSGDFATRAFASGAIAGGRGTIVTWVVDDDGQPCPDCDDNALAGEVAAGEEFPTGHVHPPVHPGCRCLLVPASS